MKNEHDFSFFINKTTNRTAKPHKIQLCSPVFVFKNYNPSDGQIRGIAFCGQNDMLATYRSTYILYTYTPHSPFCQVLFKKFQKQLTFCGKICYNKYSCRTLPFGKIHGKEVEQYAFTLRFDERADFGCRKYVRKFPLRLHTQLNTKALRQ